MIGIDRPTVLADRGVEAADLDALLDPRVARRAKALQRRQDEFVPALAITVAEQVIGGRGRDDEAALRTDLAEWFLP